jgi:hypothetical protein
MDSTQLIAENQVVSSGIEMGCVHHTIGWQTPCCINMC